MATTSKCILLGAAIVLAAALNANPARADTGHWDHRDHHWHDYHHHDRSGVSFGFYSAPPVVYADPYGYDYDYVGPTYYPRYYYPPPPVVYGGPDLGLNLRFNIH